MKRSILLVALAALSVSGTAHATNSYSDSKKYTQATGDQFILQCDASDPDLGGIGGVCFTLRGDELKMLQATITDDVSPFQVGGYWAFSDKIDIAEGVTLASGTFCGSVSNLDIPAGAAAFSVFVDLALGPVDCATNVGVGIQGMIDVTFQIPEEQV